MSKKEIITFRLQSDYYFIVDNNPNKIHNGRQHLFICIDIKRTYGNLAAITWKKLNRKKILSKLNYINLRRNFYKNIYQDFSKLIYKVLSVVPANKVKNYEKLLVFIDCLPKLSKMNKILRNGENVINNKVYICS